MKLASSLLCAASILGSVACGGSNDPAKDPSSTASNVPAPPPPVSMDTAPATTAPSTDATAASTTTGTMTSTTTSTTADTSATLTDEQIVAIANAANTSEIDAAKLAQSKAKNPQVRKFASMMIQDHGEAKAKVAKTTAKFKLTPQDSTISTQLASDSQSGLDGLKAKSGPDFDKAYIDAQVKAHTDVLTMLDTKLIPNAKNPELKADLQALRPKVEQHLKDAQALQAKLQ